MIGEVSSGQCQNPGGDDAFSKSLVQRRCAFTAKILEGSKHSDGSLPGVLRGFKLESLQRAGFVAFFVLVGR